MKDVCNCKTSWCLVVNKWNNDGSCSVIILIEGVISLVVDNHVVQDNASMHDQSKSVPRVRPEHSLYFFSKLITSQRRISASLVEEETYPS
jgi:hypothetical protein